jgi:hypothetical protein
MVGDEKVLDANNIVKESFQRTQFERRMLFIQRRKRRRKEYRKRKKLKNGIVVEVEETIDKYGSKVKRKKARDKNSDKRDVAKKKPLDKLISITKRRKMMEIIYGNNLLVNQISSPRNILCKEFNLSAGHLVRSLRSAKAVIRILLFSFVYFMEDVMKSSKMLVISRLKPTSATNPPPGVGPSDAYCTEYT